MDDSLFEYGNKTASKKNQALVSKETFLPCIFCYPLLDKVLVVSAIVELQPSGFYALHK